MTATVDTEYCSFTKAVEHLGDRWSLLILRELIVSGPMGFNALAAGVPGHISRSVLTDRLQRLRDLGLISRGGSDGGDGSGHVAYRLTGPGEALVPAFLALRAWADDWLPDDPAMVVRDPEVLLGWLAQRIRLGHLPERQAVVELSTRDEPVLRSWIVVEAGAKPYACLEDPQLDPARYVYAETGSAVLLALARGRRDWRDAIGDGSVQVFGDPELVRELPAWFKSGVTGRAGARA